MSAKRWRVGLEEVGAALEAWRAHRRKGERIPAEVWRQAGKAARQYGVNAVSRALRLDYYELKKRTERGVPVGPGRTFVELTDVGTAPARRAEEGMACVVELQKGNGARMRICVRDTVAVDWGKLKEAFLGA